MKDIFGQFKELKDGSMGKVLQMPELHELQRDRETIHDWIYYSVLDTESTWQLRNELERRLRAMPWKSRNGLEWDNVDAPGVLDMFDFYRSEWLPMGELLTEMETLGMKVDLDHLRTIEKEAKIDEKAFRAQFVSWAESFCPAARWMNVDSDAQKQQLFFANCKNKKTGAIQPLREFTATLANEEELDEFERWQAEQREATGEEAPVKRKTKKRSLNVKFELRGGLSIEPVEFTPSGWPAGGAATLQQLAGDVRNKNYGSLHDALVLRGSTQDEAARGCEAVDAMLKAGKVSTLLSTFIEPLQLQCDANERIHTSLNINTETGRLSSRRPNLQNQPALEKDTYKVRKSFTCEPGNALVVADYGQLELRLLAHISNCRSMIDAFEQGGDFHSRTAIGMYPHIQQAVTAGDVLLEWDYEGGQAPPVPLVKDQFGSERRKAKVLNFSIAYGKTPHGLAKDFNVSLSEAKETLERWYADRPEVRAWQEATIARARETGYTRTLLGRYRPLPGITGRNMGARGHAERAAINTPLQGGAADIVNRAMINTRGNQRLRDLGWKQVLQVHDEIIVEGPKDCAEEAMDILVKTMMHPLDEPLRVELPVDATMAQTWFEGK
jgi:DNA polymerase I